MFHRGFGGGSCVRGIGNLLITGRPKSCRYAELSLLEACVSQLQKVQWGLESAEINVKIAYSVLAVQSANQIHASDSSMGRTWPWKSLHSNLVMLKFYWHLKKNNSPSCFLLCMISSWAIKQFFHGILPGFEILGRALKLHQMKDKAEAEICGLICVVAVAQGFSSLSSENWHIQVEDYLPPTLLSSQCVFKVAFFPCRGGV